jgi:hypothetical protein
VELLSGKKLLAKSQSDEERLIHSWVRRRGVTGNIPVNICMVFKISVALQDMLHDLFSNPNAIVS